MRLELGIMLKPALEVNWFEATTAEAAMLAIKNQLEAAQVIWPELRVFEIKEKKDDL
jgi:hypothetical protein